jgi:plasmid stabilization system protein ParE
MTFRFAPAAEREYLAALEWLRDRNPTAAQGLHDSVVSIVTALAAREFEGREVVIESGRSARRWPVGSLVIYYRRRGDVLEVLRVFDARRAPIER